MEMSGVEQWHKRRALYVLGKLPEDVKDAAIVLGIVRQLFETWLQDVPQRATEGLGSVIQLWGQSPPAG